MQKGEIYKYTASVKIYYCPFDRTNTRALYLDWVGRAVKTTSYVMNGAVCEYGRLAAGASIKQSNIRQGDAILMWETDEKTPFFFNDFSSFPYEGITQRHNIGALVGVHTGSAEFITFKNWYQMAGSSAAAAPLGGNRLWWAPDTKTGN
jgi:hypothetical protein